MFRYLFKPYKIARHSRESYMYSERDGRCAEVVVYSVPNGAPKYWIDDVALSTWLKPEPRALTEGERGAILARMREHLGGSVRLESERTHN